MMMLVVLLPPSESVVLTIHPQLDDERNCLDFVVTDQRLWPEVLDSSATTNPASRFAWQRFRSPMVREVTSRTGALPFAAVLVAVVVAEMVTT